MWDRDEIRRQLEAQLLGLRGAGVEWLPLGPPLEIAVKVERTPPVAVPPKVAAQVATPIASMPAPVGHENSGDLDQRRRSLKLLADEVAQCMKCAGLASTRTQTVFAQGGPGVELCFIGEAPGADEDAQGLPFVGAAGQLLTKIIEACGMKREEVYICNILKCRPPGNRTPHPDEANNCKGFLQRQLELVQPKYIVALGSCAASNLLNTTLSIGKMRGRFHDYQGIPVMVTYHPAYLLPHRSPEKKREVWDDMKWLLQQMGREPPKKE